MKCYEIPFVNTKHHSVTINETNALNAIVPIGTFFRVNIMHIVYHSHFAPTEYKTFLCSKMPPLPANATAESRDWKIDPSIMFC